MDFMQLAKAKGLSYGQTITRHALRNSCVSFLMAMVMPSRSPMGNMTRAEK